MSMSRPPLDAAGPVPAAHGPAGARTAAYAALHAAQQPPWEDHEDLECIRAELAALPVLATPGAVRDLRTALARVERGDAFLLHVGECAETFAMADPAQVAARAELYQRLADRLSDRTGKETVLVARMAGQHAKPRSEPLETLPDGTSLPVYRGDAVNDLEPKPDSRRADPWRLLTSYDRSRDTLAVLRALPPAGRPVHVSHEALLRDYEDPLTRGGRVRYAGSGHLVWIGERTRGPGDWHVNWAASVANPVGVKLGPSVAAGDAAELVRLLNAGREEGRLSLITRMGAAAPERLAALAGALAADRRPLLWSCDPMHANTVRSGGAKLRLLPDLRAEVTAFVRALRAAGWHPGGLHLEVTPQDVAECHEVLPADPARGSQPPCDPRLNPAQALAIVDHFAAEATRS